MKCLNQVQLNNLMTGIKLSLELPMKNEIRKFLTVFAYEYDENGNYKSMSNIIKSNRQKEVFFEVRIYEISTEYFSNNWDISEEDLASDIRIDDVKGLKSLEEKLRMYLEDLSRLKPEWQCDNPL